MVVTAFTEQSVMDYTVNIELIEKRVAVLSQSVPGRVADATGP